MVRIYPANMLCPIYFTTFQICCLFGALFTAATDFTPHKSLLFVGKGPGMTSKNFAHQINSLYESVQCLYARLTFPNFPV